MKVAVLGSSGMLGGMVTKYLKVVGHNVTEHSRVNGFNVLLPTDCDVTDGCALCLLDELFLDNKPDYIVNCIGTIKPMFTPDYLADAIYTNAIFPRLLADWCNQENIKLIHITTDCVFSGQKGKYTEEDKHDALDDYGKSKSLGEPANCMVLRTSIIGPEFDGNKRSLLEWLFSQNGKEINGYTNHLWNGVTTLELAKLINLIMKRDLYGEEVFHLHSEDITKNDLLSLYRDVFALDIKINAVEVKDVCDRTLRSVKSLGRELWVKTQREMALDLREFVRA